MEWKTCTVTEDGCAPIAVTLLGVPSDTPLTPALAVQAIRAAGADIPAEVTDGGKIWQRVTGWALGVGRQRRHDHPRRPVGRPRKAQQQPGA